MYFAAQPLPHVEEFVKKHYKGGSVLDFGCGTGRYVHLFDDYTGIDGYESNISFCKANWPDKRFILADLETWKPDKKYDYVFSSVTLEQLSKLPDLKKYAKHIILVEPLNGIHDYHSIGETDFEILRGTDAVGLFYV